MKDDLLRRASLALRETTDRGPADAVATRARVVATLRERRKRRLELFRIILPLAAILIASTAWAATSGGLRRFVSALGLGAKPDATVEAPASRAAPALSRAAIAVVYTTARDPLAGAPAADPTPAVPETPGDPVDAEAALPTSVPPIVSATTAPAVVAAPSASASARRHGEQDSAEVHALYTAAHRAHFAERNWSAALAGWNAYLAAAPRGQFAAEAQYNRALCLVRLGREAEARSALGVFARGGYGGYRRAEAQAVLDAMGAGPEGRSP